jgi:hypothetical protein
LTRRTEAEAPNAFDFVLRSLLVFVHGAQPAPLGEELN